MSDILDLRHLSHAEKDALIHVLWAHMQGLTARVEAREARLAKPAKTPDNSSLPPSKSQNSNRPEQTKRVGLRKGSLSGQGGGRPLSCDPNETVTAKAVACVHCQAALSDADQVLHGCYDKIDLPKARPVVTQVKRYAGHCPCCGGVTLAPVPAGLEHGPAFSVNIVALAIYLRFTHAMSYRRLTQLFLHLFTLRISEVALDAMLQRAKPCLDNKVAAILARLRRSRIIGSDETSVRVGVRTHWNWVFQIDQVVIHVVRNSRAAGVVAEVMARHRPSIWVSRLYGAQQGHADLWQICVAHQLCDCTFAMDAGDTVFAPRMKNLLLRAVVQARRRKALAESTRRAYLRRLDHDLNAIMMLAPTNRDGRRLRKRYGKVRGHLFTFLEHPDVRPDNKGSERELRPTANYRKVTGGFRSDWSADLFAAVRSVVSTASRDRR